MKNILKYNTLALVVLVVLLFITIFAFYEADKASEIRRNIHFENRVEKAQIDIKYSLQNYIHILQAAKAAIKISDTITRKEWKDFVETIEIEQNFPGIQGIGYAVVVRPFEVSSFESKIRREGFKDFKVFPEGERSIYTSILYLEPFKDRNLRALGYDMYSNEVRQAAMQYAMENRKPAFSGKVELVQETDADKQAGFLIYLPVYIKGSSRENIEERLEAIKGFVYSPFRMDDLMKATLSNEYDDLDIKIYDGSSLSAENLMFHKYPDFNFDQHGSDILPIVEKIDLGNRVWTIKYFPYGYFGPRAEISQPLIILASGIIISLLISFTISSLSYARRKALAELQRTKEMENKKDEFIGIASHELKTPLTSSRAYTELLMMTATSDNDRKLAGKALESINKLTMLVNDLLDVTKIEAGKLQLNYTEFNIHTVIDLAIENARHADGSHSIIKKGEEERITVKGDLIRLEQSIVNLLSNAIKYSPHADHIEVHVKKLETEVEVMVRDFGIGISKEDQDKIFEKFYRAEGLDENITGLGMGLHIAAEIINRHNGKMWIESEIGNGSSFYFTIPLA